jgi:hypothetical protein
MKPTSRTSPDELHNDDTAHEESDINIRGVVTATIVVAVVCIGTAVLMAGLFKVLKDQAAARDPQLSPIAMKPADMPNTTTADPTFGNAPDPRLLTDEPKYLSSVQGEWQKELNTYGWVDQQAGVIHIPIDRAKELLAHRGLPVRAEPVEDATVGTHGPAVGEASSGRTITKPVTEAKGEVPAAPPAEHKPAAEGHK